MGDWAYDLLRRGVPNIGAISTPRREESRTTQFGNDGSDVMLRASSVFGLLGK